MNICPACGFNKMEADYDEDQGPFWRCPDCGYCEARCSGEGLPPMKLHRRIEFGLSWPWQFTSIRYWIFFWTKGESRERRYINLTLLGIRVEYSWQFMPDGEAEDLLDFIQQEQAADYWPEESEYPDPDDERYWQNDEVEENESRYDYE